MRLWRITTRKWALDRSCDGARLNGGRWNPVGYPAMYAGTTIEICALEKFVHLEGARHPPMVLVSIEVPDDEALLFQPSPAEFPVGWADLPPSPLSQEFGRRWLDSASHLVMLVPSAIIPESAVAVINPMHPSFGDVTLQTVREFAFDARMFKSP